MRERLIKRRLKIAMIGIVAVTAFGFVVMGLWNWLAPPLFGGRTIDFWQALGILALSKILLEDFAVGEVMAVIGRAGCGTVGSR